MKNPLCYIALVFLPFYSSVSSAQTSVKAKLVFEYLLSYTDTSYESKFDTVYIGVDTKGRPGYQAGLDEFKDSLRLPGTYIFDSIFNTQYPNKYLTTSIEEFKISNTTGPNFRVRTNGKLINIYYDTSDFSEFVKGDFDFIFGLAGPEGSSIGSWDNNSLFLVFYKQFGFKNEPIPIIELPLSCEIRFYFSIFDSATLSLSKYKIDPNVIVAFSQNKELIVMGSSIPKIESLHIYNITGETINYPEPQETDNMKKFDLSFLKSGIYLYHIFTLDGVKVGKFILSE